MVEPEPRVPPSVRKAVFAAAGGCCEYCLAQASFSPSPFSIEHVVPHRTAAATTSRTWLSPAWDVTGTNTRRTARIR